MIPTRWLLTSTEYLHRPRGLVLLAWILAIAALVAGVGWLVYATGGIMFVYSHTIYIPILLAAMVFGVPGGLLTAVAGGLVLGPWMPIDVAAGTMQETLNWVYRLLILSFIGSIAGGMFQLLHAQLDRFRSFALEDAETDLPNQRSLELSVMRALEHVRERTAGDTDIYVVTIKLTNFNEIVNSLGMSAGRDLMHTVSEGLQEFEDEATSAFRMYSDSFGLLMAGVKRQQCYGMVKRVLTVVESAQLVEGVPVQLECNVGIAAFPYHESDDPEMLIRKSVMALQQAVDSGKQWSTYDRRHDESRRETLAMLGALRPAIERDELELHYQPKVCLGTGALHGMEALVRWRREGELVPPDRFIPAAERSGLIHPLTRWVVETAARQVVAWHSRGWDIPVAVNISGRNLSDDGFIAYMREIMGNYGIEAGMMTIELTENSIYADADGGVKRLRALNELGLELSIDDFGTGYSSLSNLRRLPVQELKLDRSFVSRITFDDADRDIVTSAIQIAKGMGMRTVAEGIEDEGTVRVLVGLQCTVGQGYHFSRPMPSSEATEWLEGRLRSNATGSG